MPETDERVEVLAKAIHEVDRFDKLCAGYRDQARAALAALDAYDRAPKVTHGRHCTCKSCAIEDWTNPALAPCGMHGPSCPREYAPIGPPGSLVGRPSEGEPIEPSDELPGIVDLSAENKQLRAQVKSLRGASQRLLGILLVEEEDRDSGWDGRLLHAMGQLDQSLEDSPRDTAPVEPSDRDLLRALAAASVGFGPSSLPLGVLLDLVALGLFETYERPIDERTGYRLTDKARDAIRQAINREDG